MRIICVFIFLILINFGSIAQQTLRVMFLGNSYTGVNNLPQLVSNVASSAGDSLIFSSNTPGGYTLDQHFQDNTSLNLIHQGIWDYVVLQEQSQLPSFQYYYSSGPQDLEHEFSKYNPCGRTMFYMTWGRKNGDGSNCAAWPPVCTYEGMDSLLSLRYFEMATTSEALVSPVGRVWNRIRHLYPAIELYQTDESHPSEAGSYAAACCFYAALFKSDPLNITFDYTLTPSDAATIRQLVKEVVYDSLSLYDFTLFNPAALFYYWIGTGNNEIVLLNTSSAADNYLWDFGDGDTSTALYPHHSYSADGNYIITLTAFDCDLDSTYQSVYQLPVSFCSYTPTIYPDTAILCPNDLDTLWTQQYDSYQWLDGNGDSIAGETNRYFVPGQFDNYSVLTSLNNCSERSQFAYVESYLHNLVIYNIDSSFVPDTVCAGDTTMLILYPNKPSPLYYLNHWYQNGVPLNFHGDTLMIISQGTYSVEIENQMCPGYIVFQSGDMEVDFTNCNISVPEYLPQKFEIFPIPAHNKLFLKQQDKKAFYYQIFDILGRSIDGMATDEIDLSNLTPGIYYLKMEGTIVKVIKN